MILLINRYNFESLMAPPSFSFVKNQIIFRISYMLAIYEI